MGHVRDTGVMAREHGHLRLEAAREEVMREVGHVVERVVVCDHRVLAVAQPAVVDDRRRPAVVRTEDGGCGEGESGRGVRSPRVE